jgi:4-hydroxybenzoate polyprenyltransferase
MKFPKAGDVADLVRLPSVLSVPGDVLLGTTTSARGEHPLRIAGLTAASSCLYMAGMALNDYADRDVDAKERPKRPIPSGRVSSKFALRLASGLSAASLGLAYTAGGRRALEVALPLAATVWAYDLALKKTPWGPLGMAACRSLDILMGSLGSRKSWPAAGVVGGHTFLITVVSRREAQGGTRELALGSLAGTAAVTAAAAKLALKGTGSKPLGRPVRQAASALLLGAHAVSMGKAEFKAIREPSAENLQRVVGAGVLGLMPLEAGMLAGAGGIGKAATLAAGWRFARQLSRWRAVT